jgi:molybdate transport system substrate-binding protein
MADTVRILSTLALKGAVQDLAGQYQAAGGARIDADFAPTLALLDRLRAGEAADVVILTREGLDEVAREGRVVTETSVDLARSFVGIAVKAGAAHPDIATRRRCARRYSARARWRIRGLAPAAFCSQS